MMSSIGNLVNKVGAGIFGLTILLTVDGLANAQEKATKAADEVFADLSKPGSPGCARL